MAASGSPRNSDRPSDGDDEADYGVFANESGDVVIRLGAVPPFEVPPAVAIKLAGLLLKKAGAVVKISPGSLVARYGGISNRSETKGRKH